VISRGTYLPAVRTLFVLAAIPKEQRASDHGDQKLIASGKTLLRGEETRPVSVRVEGQAYHLGEFKKGDHCFIARWVVYRLLFEDDLPFLYAAPLSEDLAVHEPAIRKRVEDKLRVKGLIV